MTTSWLIKLTSNFLFNFEISIWTNVSGAEAPAVSPMLIESLKLKLFKKIFKSSSSEIKYEFETPFFFATSTSLWELEEF